MLHSIERVAPVLGLGIREERVGNREMVFELWVKWTLPTRSLATLASLNEAVRLYIHSLTCIHTIAIRTLD